MANFGETRFRDCSWCGTKNIAMDVRWSDRFVRGSSGSRAWAVLTCPRCAGATLMEVGIPSNSGSSGAAISPGTTVVEIAVLPAGDETLRKVNHLPDDVARFYSDAQRVYEAGVPDAAAVQLRKALEAAAAHKGIDSGALYVRVKKLIEDGYVTKDFSGLLDHVRQIGNIGAHATDTVLSPEDVGRAMRFTTQILRNLFEVPGELAELEAETTSAAPEG